MKAFQGTGVAMITPFDNHGDIDFQGLKKLTNHLIDGGVEYLVVMGTTGESVTLSQAEKKTVLDFVIEKAAGRCKIVYGVGGNNTAQLVETLNQTDFKGVDALLSVSPYYNKPTQEGIYQHYKALAEASTLPIILYNVPGRTGSNMSAQTTLRLAYDFENIIAIKEASGNMEQVMEIIQGRPEGFLVISGDDNLTFPMLALGGDGVISVSGQAYPAIFSEMVRMCIRGEIAAARAAHFQLFHFTQLLFAEGNPGGIKVALEQLGICGPTMRQPLWPVSQGLKAQLVACMQNI
jgi:4-hydroxy-tetrahydrodipicolinate synthase